MQKVDSIIFSGAVNPLNPNKLWDNLWFWVAQWAVSLLMVAHIFYKLQQTLWIRWKPFHKSPQDSEMAIWTHTNNNSHIIVKSASQLILKRRYLLTEWGRKIQILVDLTLLDSLVPQASKYYLRIRKRKGIPAHRLEPKVYRPAESKSTIVTITLKVHRTKGNFNKFNTQAFIFLFGNYFI